MVRRGSTVRVRQRASRSPCRSAPSGWERDHRRAPRRPPSVHRLSGLSPPRFRGDCFDWFPTLIRGLVSGTYRLAWCRSNSAGGTPPSEVCRRSVLNHAWIELAREKHGSRFQDLVRTAQLEHLATQLADLLTLLARRQVWAAAFVRFRPGGRTCAASPTATPDQQRRARSDVPSRTPTASHGPTSSTGCFLALGMTDLLPPGKPWEQSLRQNRDGSCCTTAAEEAARVPRARVMLAQSVQTKKSRVLNWPRLLNEGAAASV
jgi:hypothetical protein